MLPRRLIAAIFMTAITVPLAIAQDEAIQVDPAIAGMTPEALVQLRRDVMQQNGSTLRSAMRATGDEAVAAAELLLQNYTNLPEMFPEGSIVGRSEATPAIWENWEDFRGRFEANATSAAVAVEAAKMGDNASFAAALQEISRACGACHQAYRS